MLLSEQRALPNDGCWDTFSKLWHRAPLCAYRGRYRKHLLSGESEFGRTYAAAMFLVLDLVVAQGATLNAATCLGAPSRASSRCCWPRAGHAPLAVGTAPRRRRGLTQHSVGRCSQSALRSCVPLACVRNTRGRSYGHGVLSLRAAGVSWGEHRCLAEFSKRRYCKQAAFRASLASPVSSCAVLARCFRSQEV